MHWVVCRLDETDRTVAVLRILHMQMDLPRHLPRRKLAKPGRGG